MSEESSAASSALKLPFTHPGQICYVDYDQVTFERPKDDMDVSDESKPQYAAAFSTLVWKKKHLYVYFLEKHYLGMEPQIMEWASEWSKYCGVRFHKITTPDGSDIRVSFSMKGSYSYIGTNAVNKTPTMNLGFIDKATVIHEFGHALGLVHEHQRPDAMKWNREKVIEYYEGPPHCWNPEQINDQIFTKYNVDTGTYFYDTKSIMHYPFPAEWIEGAQQDIKRNEELSELDKVFIRRLYGDPSPEFNTGLTNEAAIIPTTGPSTTPITPIAPDLPRGTESDRAKQIHKIEEDSSNAESDNDVENMPLSAKEAVDKYSEELMEHLPLDLPLFLGKMKKTKLFHLGTEESISEERGRAKKVTYYLNHAFSVQPDEDFPKLCKVMKESKISGLIKLAKQMEAEVEPAPVLPRRTEPVRVESCQGTMNDRSKRSYPGDDAKSPESTEPKKQRTDDADDDERCKKIFDNITKNIANLTEAFPIDLLMPELCGKGVVDGQQKEVIDNKTLKQQKVFYLFDEIIKPELAVGGSTKYDNLIKVMKAKAKRDPTTERLVNLLQGWDMFSS